MDVVTRLPDGSEKVQRFSHPSGGRGCLADLEYPSRSRLYFRGVRIETLHTPHRSTHTRTQPCPVVAESPRAPARAGHHDTARHTPSLPDVQQSGHELIARRAPSALAHASAG